MERPKFTPLQFLFKPIFSPPKEILFRRHHELGDCLVTFERIEPNDVPELIKGHVVLLHPVLDGALADAVAAGDRSFIYEFNLGLLFCIHNGNYTILLPCVMNLFLAKHKACGRR